MLYHIEVKWPKKIKNSLPFGNRKLEYSRHAKQEARQDRYGNVILPDSVDMANCSVFEAEWNGKLVKIAMRVKLDEKRDLVIVGIPQMGGLFVKTVWINLRNDSHKTLNKNKYCS